MKIFLDLDGTIVNFAARAAVLMGWEPEKLLAVWHPGEYDITKVLNVKESEFFDVVDAAGEDFW